MSQPIELLSPKAISHRLHASVSELRTLRRRGRFPEPDARIGRRHGWSPERIDRYAVETLGWERPANYPDYEDTGTVAGVPEWWLTPPKRYIGLAELAEASVLSTAAVWSHYYNGKLPSPDVTIGHRNRVAGWTPARAKALAREQGWRLDLARLEDTSDLGNEL